MNGFLNTRTALAIAWIAAIAAPTAALADAASDALLNSLGGSAADTPAAQADAPKPAPTAAQRAAQPDAEPVWQVDLSRLDNTYLKLLYSMWQTDPNLSRQAKGWVVDVMAGKYAAAVGGWDAIKPNLPASFAVAGRTALLYSLWKLPAPSTFVTEWLSAISDPAFKSARVAAELDHAVDRDFAAKLAQSGLILTPEQAEKAKALTDGEGVGLTLRAIAAQRTGEQGMPILQTLPAGHPMILPLAQSVLLARVKAANLAGAARILKQYIEPALRGAGNPVSLAQHYMNVGRLLFQAGLDDAAEALYGKVPNGVPQFLEAREELAWVHLRKGENESLRGDLTTLASPLFEKQFLPDAPVLLAISHLERCYYDRIPGVIADFARVYGPKAKEIEAALAAKAAPVAPRVDFYSRQAEIAAGKLTTEAAGLAKVAGAYAAQAAEKAKAGAAYAKSRMEIEYRRQWKAMSTELQEAIRKMHFVKVELMSRIQAPSVADLPQSAAARQASAPKGTASMFDRGNRMVFPVDGIMWPDELFHLQARAQSQCLMQQKAGSS
jgi:hypothetical protein